MREKFGFFDLSFILQPSTFIWVHAVSVGEVMAAMPLLRKLKSAYPQTTIVLSTITDTGQNVAREKSPHGTIVVYLPFDIPVILRSVIHMLNPALFIIIETELWPNLLRLLKKSGILVILLNGRISDRSFRGYRMISFFMRKVLTSVDCFGVQNEEYAERLRRLHADSGTIHVLGSFKFDADPPAHIPEWAKVIGQPSILAGSTHEGEEELIVSAYTNLRKDFPDLNLVIAPRHPERFGRVENILSKLGVPFLKRSDLIVKPQAGTIHGTIILLDSVGELPALYGISSIAIIGKSFKGEGGQNPLEPAYWGVPVICGPHMENFPVVGEFYRAGAAIRVNEVELPNALRELILSPEKAKEMGLRARDVYRRNAGAVDRAMTLIEQHIPNEFSSKNIPPHPPGERGCSVSPPFREGDKGEDV